MSNNTLTQRPAAQTEREAFEAWATSLGYNTERDMFQRDMYQSTLTWELWRVWQARASLPAPQQATPEPVGEPFGWWFTEDPDVFSMPGSGFRRYPNKPQHTVECIALYTRPAPGVPEVLLANVIEALREGLSVCMSVTMSRDRKISRDGCTLYAQTDEWCRWLETEVGPQIRAALDALAAAQAKGGEHE